MQQWARHRYPATLSWCIPPKLSAKTAQFISMTVVNATMRFKSLWAGNLEPASKRPITAKAPVSKLKLGVSAINRVLYRPSTPTLTMYPLSKIENSTDASTWAFNSQDVLGHRGTFTPKPTRKHRAATKFQRKGDVQAMKGPPTKPSPVRSPALPTKVQTNISKAASRTRSDLDVRSSIYKALSKRNSKEKNMTHKLSVTIKTSPAAKLTKPARLVPPRTDAGLVCDRRKNGKLAIRRAPKTPISIASQPLREKFIFRGDASSGVPKLGLVIKLIKIKTVLYPTRSGRKLALFERPGARGLTPQDTP